MVEVKRWWAPGKAVGLTHVDLVPTWKCLAQKVNRSHVRTLCGTLVVTSVAVHHMCARFSGAM